MPAFSPPLLAIRKTFHMPSCTTQFPLAKWLSISQSQQNQVWLANISLSPQLNTPSLRFQAIINLYLISLLLRREPGGLIQYYKMDPIALNPKMSFIQTNIGYNLWFGTRISHGPPLCKMMLKILLGSISIYLILQYCGGNYILM